MHSLTHLHAVGSRFQVGLHTRTQMVFGSVRHLMSRWEVSYPKGAEPPKWFHIRPVRPEAGLVCTRSLKGAVKKQPTNHGSR
jgi:hypothetical protein